MKPNQKNITGSYFGFKPVSACSKIRIIDRNLLVIFNYFLIRIVGWNPYCIHSARRPLLAYVTRPG
jgi:hypothetical protein